jgi:hypothetical protein
MCLLQVPNVSLTPTLDQIQEAINATAKKILSTSKKLRCWGMSNGPPTYYDLIARDKEVVKVVLLLTGSIEGTKQQVAEYVRGFEKYKFLWTQDLQVGLQPVTESIIISCALRYAQHNPNILRTSLSLLHPEPIVCHAVAGWLAFEPCNVHQKANSDVYLLLIQLCCLQSTYDAFMRTNPTLEAFEVELKKYMALETEIAAITAVHNIGEYTDKVCLLSSS